MRNRVEERKERASSLRCPRVPRFLNPSIIPRNPLAPILVFASPYAICRAFQSSRANPARGNAWFRSCRSLFHPRGARRAGSLRFQYARCDQFDIGKLRIIASLRQNEGRYSWEEGVERRGREWRGRGRGGIEGRIMTTCKQESINMLSMIKLAEVNCFIARSELVTN